MLAAAEYPPDANEIRDHLLTLEDITRIEAAITAGKSNRVPTKPSKPLPSNGPSESDIRHALDMCQDSYVNEEWEVVSAAYGELLEMGIDWVPFALARAAYASSQLRDVLRAYPMAKKSMEQYPVEPDAYAAMAVIKHLMGQPLQAELWLQLALKAADTVPPSYKDIQAGIDWYKAQCMYPPGREK